MESEHDDQLRAWMKQVRDVSYIAKDCVQTYVSDIDPLQVPICSCAFLHNLPRIIWTCRKRHRLGKKIQDLKVRVLEVGERHKRYNVTFRSTQARKRSVANKKGADEEAQRKDFLMLYWVLSVMKTTAVAMPSLSVMWAKPSAIFLVSFSRELLLP
jgi:hypothetical protein